MLFSWFSIHWFVSLLLVVFALATALHALTHKRDPRSALLWIVICVSLPLAGAVFYLLLGINRANTKVQKLGASPNTLLCEVSTTNSKDNNSSNKEHDLSPHQLLGSALTGCPVTEQNHIDTLINGEQAYPAMLEAINNARSWIYLSSYIFESEEIGSKFIESLVYAKHRGVDVHILLDGVGAWYDRDRTRKRLLEKGIDAISFLPPLHVFPRLTINLRNHRKILLVDGEFGFVGGMNIRQCHLTESATLPTKDMMFCVQGSVLQQVGRVFEEDWFYTSGIKLAKKQYINGVEGLSKCRVISDGPGVHLDSLTKVLISAINQAESSITIVTPYFLPPRELIIALQSASIRGVEVSLLLPEKNNLPYVHWAMRHGLHQLLSFGIRVYYQPSPFDHSKLFVVDESYSQIGSANLDSRSLRLNFEMNIEVYDEDFGQQLSQRILSSREQANEVTFAELEKRSYPNKVWDAFFWLFTPYM